MKYGDLLMEIDANKPGTAVVGTRAAAAGLARDLFLV